MVVNQVYFERQAEQSSINSRGSGVSSYNYSAEDQSPHGRSQDPQQEEKKKWFEVSARHRISSSGSQEDNNSESDIYRQSEYSKRESLCGKEEEEVKGSPGLNKDRRLLKQSVQHKGSKDFYCSRKSIERNNFLGANNRVYGAASPKSSFSGRSNANSAKASSNSDPKSNSLSGSQDSRLKQQ